MSNWNAITLLGASWLAWVAHADRLHVRSEAGSRSEAQ